MTQMNLNHEHTGRYACSSAPSFFLYATHMVELARRPTLLMLLKSRRFEKNHMIKVIPTAQTMVDSVPPRIV